MPSLNRVLEVISPMLTNTAEAERLIRREFPDARIHIPPLGSRKDPARREQIVRLSRTLPTGTIAQRLNVSASYCRRVIRQSRAAKSSANRGIDERVAPTGAGRESHD